MVQSFDTAMLVTDLDDTPNGRPMSVAKHDSDGVLWFVTSKSTSKAREIEEDSAAVVTLQSKSAYAVLNGRASLDDSLEKKKELWSKSMQLWWPEGPEDEEIVAVRFAPSKGQYWDMRGAKGLKFAAEAVRAWATGESMDQDIEGSSGTATLR